MEILFEGVDKSRLLELAGIAPEPAIQYMVEEFDKKFKPVLFSGLVEIKKVIDVILPFFEKFAEAVPQWEKVLKTTQEINKLTLSWGKIFKPELKKSPLTPPTSSPFKGATFGSIKDILMDFRPIFFYLNQLEIFLNDSHKLLMMSHDNDEEARNFSETSDVMNTVKQYYKAAYPKFKENAKTIFKNFDINLEEVFTMDTNF